MGLIEAVEKLLIQINKDENEGGLLSRETHRAAGNVRIAINQPDQSVNEDGRKRCTSEQ